MKAEEKGENEKGLKSEIDTDKKLHESLFPVDGYSNTENMFGFLLNLYKSNWCLPSVSDTTKYSYHLDYYFNNCAIIFSYCLFELIVDWLLLISISVVILCILLNDYLSIIKNNHLHFMSLH